MSEARKIELATVSIIVTPRFSQEGSIMADTVQSRLIDVGTELEITSAAPREAVQQAVATAERMCFMLDAVRAPHPVSSTTRLNGEPLD